jgi:hypothetical protein
MNPIAADHSTMAFLKFEVSVILKTIWEQYAAKTTKVPQSPQSKPINPA